MSIRLQLKYWLAALTFFTAGVWALLNQQPVLMALPFIVILILPVYKLVVYKLNWIFFGLIALLPLSTEVNFTPRLGLDFPVEFLMMFLSALIIAKVIYKPSILSARFINHPLFLLCLLHLGWILITTIFSLEPILSLKFLLAKVWFIVPFVIAPYYFIKEKNDVRLLVWLLLVPMGVVVIQALVRHAFLNFSFEGVKEVYSPFFRNHVNFSAMLVCMLAILFSVYKLMPKPGVYKKIVAISLLIGIIAVVFAYSRGAWLAIITGLVAYWLIQKKLIGSGIALTCIIIISTTVWLVADNNYLQFSPDYNSTIFHKDINEHLQATVQLKDVSNAERFYRWVAGFNMIADKPFTGFGPNNFYDYYRSYTETPFKTWVSNNPEHSSVHNYFILTSVEQGLPGLLFFCLLYFGMIVYSQKLYHSLEEIFYQQVAITIGVILAMIAPLIFMSDLIETDKIGSLFWLSLGLLIVLDLKRKSTLNKT